MQRFIGIKDGVLAFATIGKGKNINDAYLLIGKALGIDVTDPGNVDLDEIYELPITKVGKAVKLSPK